jgi:hypothetical protein
MYRPIGMCLGYAIVDPLVNVYSNVSDPNDMYCCYTSDFAWSDEITYTAFSIPTMSLRLTALSTNQNSDKP